MCTAWITCHDVPGGTCARQKHKSVRVIDDPPLRQIHRSYTLLTCRHISFQTSCKLFLLHYFLFCSDSLSFLRVIVCVLVTLVCVTVICDEKLIRYHHSGKDIINTYTILGSFFEFEPFGSHTGLPLITIVHAHKSIT